MKHHRQPVTDRRIPVALATLAAVISLIAFLQLADSTSGSSIRITASAEPNR